MATITASQKMNNRIRCLSTAMLTSMDKMIGQQIRKTADEDHKLALRITLNRISAELLNRGLTYCYSCRKWTRTHQDGECKK